MMKCILKVTGYTDRNGCMWDMICFNQSIGIILVDPWVGCALPIMTDEEMLSLIGKIFEMSEAWQHQCGTWLCHKFEELKDLSSSNDTVSRLVEMNDRGVPFCEIADWIEKRL